MPGRLYLIHNQKDLGALAGAPCPFEALPRRNIKPGETLLVLTKGGWSEMRWGIIPVGRINARGRPVMETIINARSETVFDKSAFQGTGRAVVFASGWYEWTGEKRKKTVWDLSLASGELLAIAAIWDTWDGPGGISLAQVATLTTDPNDDVRPIHHRMGVFLRPDQIKPWLSDADPGPFLGSLPNGKLKIAQTRDPETLVP